MRNNAPQAQAGGIFSLISISFSADGALLRPTITAVMSCLDPALRERSDFRRHNVWSRLAEPPFFSSFALEWPDAAGRVRRDRGYIAAWPGPRPRRRIWFREDLTGDRIQALLFQELLAAHLAPEPRGVILWGVRRDPGPLRDGESMALCRSLRNAADAFIRGPWEVPAGAPEREAGYLAGFQSPPPPAPEEAEGYGLLCLADAALKTVLGRGAAGMTAVILGGGPLGDAAARAARRLGAGAILRDPAFPPPLGAVFFLCDPHAPLDASGAAALLRSGAGAVFEGCPLACAPEAVSALDREGILFVPGFAAGALQPEPGLTDWERERYQRRAADRLVRRLAARGESGLYRAAAALALENAGEALLRRGLL